MRNSYEGRVSMAPPPSVAIGYEARSVTGRARDGVPAVIDDITARLDPDDPLSARVKTLSVFAAMVGHCSSPAPWPTGSSPTRSSTRAFRTPSRC
jgi:hypothetical protein